MRPKFDSPTVKLRSVVDACLASTDLTEPDVVMIVTGWADLDYDVPNDVDQAMALEVSVNHAEYIIDHVTDPANHPH